MLRESARADSLAIGSLLRRVLGRDREKASAPAPDQRALVESADDLRRLGVDQARRVELLVRVVSFAPAVGEALPEPRAHHLLAELGPETATGVASAGSHRALDVAQFGLHVRLQRASDPGRKLQVNSSSVHWL